MLTVTDRQPTYPGRVRLVPVEGETNVYDMTRADDPIVPGTPINKELFDSIQADLSRIPPGIVTEVAAVATSKHIAWWPNLSSTGLLTVSDTTANFVAALPTNAALGAGVHGEEITLTDLPTQSGVLLLMKGATSNQNGGYFFAESGEVYTYLPTGWVALATKAYCDLLIGNISTVLDEINGEVI